MRIFESVADLEQVAGTHLGFSDWHTITQDQLNTFTEARGDHEWVHVSPDMMAKDPLDTAIAHSFLALALVPRLVWQVYAVEGVEMSVSYGANKLRFQAPVPVGSAVRAGVELLSVTSGASGHQVATRITMERAGGDKPVCVIETLSLLVSG